MRNDPWDLFLAASPRQMYNFERDVYITISWPSSSSPTTTCHVPFKMIQRRSSYSSSDCSSLAPSIRRTKTALCFAIKLLPAISASLHSPRRSPRMFHCGHCRRRFDSTKKLSRHLTRHSGARRKSTRLHKTVEELVLAQAKEFTTLAVLQRYQLVGTLRPMVDCFSGYWSDVWQGEWEAPNGQPIKVAIKYLRATQLHSDDESSDGVKEQLLKRLYKEVLSWRDLKHPHILPLLGFLPDPKPCLISPWCSQGSITKYLRRNPRANRVALLIQITDGLEYLHQKGVVHGDIKSANVLVNEQHQALLCDFGVSIVLRDSHTGFTTSDGMRGTIPYMAPELLNDERHSPESDIYALGLLALEVLSGKRPYFNFTSDGAVVTAIVCGRTPRRSDYSEVQDASFWALVEDCWSMKPQKRPDTKTIRERLERLPAALSAPSSGNMRPHPRRQPSMADDVVAEGLTIEPSNSSPQNNSELSIKALDSSTTGPQKNGKDGVCTKATGAREALAHAFPPTQYLDNFSEFSPGDNSDGPPTLVAFAQKGPYKPRHISDDVKPRPPIVQVYQKYIKEPVNNGLDFIAQHENRLHSHMKLPDIDHLRERFKNTIQPQFTTLTPVQHSGHDYESLPEEFSLASHLLVGSLAGLLETAVVHPMDTLTTRTQSLTILPSMPHRTATSNLSLFALGQSRNLWRGVSIASASAGPIHAIHFGVYESVCAMFQRGNGSVRTPSAIVTAGIASTIAATAFMNPFDVIKQRMQLAGFTPSPLPTTQPAPSPPSVLGIARHIYVSEGFRAFYTSFPTTLLATIPITTVQFTTYEYLSGLFNPSDEFSPSSHIVAGGLAGGLAGAITTPLDVAKTVLQTKGLSSDPSVRKIHGLGSALGAVWRREGLKGLSRGMVPRTMTFMPSNAICWLTYEFFKRTMS